MGNVRVESCPKGTPETLLSSSFCLAGCNQKVAVHHTGQSPHQMGTNCHSDLGLHLADPEKQVSVPEAVRSVVFCRAA